MNFLKTIVSKITEQLVDDLKAIVAVIMVYAGHAEETGADGAAKKQQVIDAMFAEFDKPGGIELPGWFRKVAPILLPTLIDTVVAVLQGKK